MSSLALSFNEVNFSPVERNGQIWLTAGDLARALGYAKANAVTQVYERNKDEFNQSMTQVIDNPQSLNLRLRIFSLRGAHLIAMFSKTAIAKQFRKWVLDVLDREVVTKQLESRQSISPAPCKIRGKSSDKLRPDSSWSNPGAQYDGLLQVLEKQQR